MDDEKQARLAVRDAVIAQIERAFDGVSRDGGVSLHEAFAIDCCVSDAEQVKARQLDTESRWQDVPGLDIEHYPSALHYLDPIGFRYYLPAYMTWTLKDYEVTGSTSSNTTLFQLRILEAYRKHYTERFERFNREQTEAICAFLRFMAGNVTEYVYENVAQQALDWYWGRFCTADA